MKQTPKPDWYTGQTAKMVSPILRVEENYSSFNSLWNNYRQQSDYQVVGKHSMEVKNTINDAFNNALKLESVRQMIGDRYFKHKPYLTLSEYIEHMEKEALKVSDIQKKLSLFFEGYRAVIKSDYQIQNLEKLSNQFVIDFQNAYNQFINKIKTTKEYFDEHPEMRPDESKTINYGQINNVSVDMNYGQLIFINNEPISKEELASELIKLGVNFNDIINLTSAIDTVKEQPSNEVAKSHFKSIFSSVSQKVLESSSSEMGKLAMGKLSHLISRASPEAFEYIKSLFN